MDGNGCKTITEKDNIKYDIFIKKFLKQLYILRDKDMSLKIVKINNIPKDFVIKWELIE